MRGIGFSHEAKYTYLSAHTVCCNIELAPRVYHRITDGVGKGPLWVM